MPAMARQASAATAARRHPLNFPYGVAVDLAGTVWISDSGNNRIRKVTRATAPTPTIQSISPASGVQGATTLAAITGSNLIGAAAVLISGTGVAASISPGGTDSNLPVVLTIDPSAVPSVRTVTVITRDRASAPFSGFTVGATSVPY